jgi:hypothetical protein
VQTTQQESHLNTVDSFDLESNDELGINGTKSSSKFKLDVADISSQKPLPATSISFATNTANRTNTMNGLFLHVTMVST